MEKLWNLYLKLMGLFGFKPGEAGLTFIIFVSGVLPLSIIGIILFFIFKYVFMFIKYLILQGVL